MDSLKILYNYWRFRHRLKFASRAMLEQWQQQKIKKFINKTLIHSPYYKPYLKKALSDFPIMNKAIMMENFDSLNTVGIKKADAFEVAFKAEETRDFTPTLNGITVGLSSGTTGTRGLFLASDAERLIWAGATLAKILPGSIFNSYKIAFFMRANSNVYTTVSKSRRLQFNFFDLLTDFNENLRVLNDYCPDILVAPARVLRLLANARDSGQLNINPSKIISVAEVLDPFDELFIQNTFQQKIHQVYQCTEGFLAITCSHGNLHLNEDMVYIEKEWIDKKNGRFVPIITDFTRTSQPIVRYRLDDVLVTHETSCSCGLKSIVIERIEGRCDDVLYWADISTQQLKPVFADFLRRIMLSASSDIKEYRITQFNPNDMEVAYAPSDNQGIELIISQLMNDLAKHLNCITPTLKFVPYAAKPLLEKLRRIERKFTLT